MQDICTKEKCVLDLYSATTGEEKQKGKVTRIVERQMGRKGLGERRKAQDVEKTI